MRLYIKTLFEHTRTARAFLTCRLYGGCTYYRCVCVCLRVRVVYARCLLHGARCTLHAAAGRMRGNLYRRGLQGDTAGDYKHFPLPLKYYSECINTNPNRAVVYPLSAQPTNLCSLLFTVILWIFMARSRESWLVWLPLKLMANYLTCLLCTFCNIMGSYSKT